MSFIPPKPPKSPIVEIKTQFALKLFDIVSLNGEEYSCIRVRWSEGEPYTLTLRRVSTDTSFAITWKILCSNEFKGELCGYTGDKTACKKTIESCRNNGNEANFGGFDAMSFNGIAELRPNEEVIDNMTPKIRHEQNRFAEMTERQLWTRLGKVTTLEKLGNFAYMAERFNKPDLAIAARARLDRLGGKPYREIIRSHMAKDTSLSNGDGERLLRKLDTI